MSSNLHQLQITYDAYQDRLVLFLHTQDFQEFRFWLTRRSAKAVFEALQKLLTSLNQPTETLDKEDRKVAEQIEKERQQQNPSVAKFAHKLTTKPLGEEPLLVSKFGIKQDKGHVVLRIESLSGKALEIGGDLKIAVALCRLIKQTATTADWQLVL